MARIYISSSWKNVYQPILVEELRRRGHQVYDFQHPSGRNDKNVWETVCERLGLGREYMLGNLSPRDFKRILLDSEAVERFKEHFAAMKDADTCIILLPCGRSSHVEAGFMNGMGKRVFVMDTTHEVSPELMYLMFDDYFYDLGELCAALAKPVPGVCRVCGCTEDNACYHPEHGNCHWIEPSLCSHCASIEEGGYGIKDDPETEHCMNDEGNAFKQGRTEK